MMFSRPTSPWQQGFTLVELLVVLAVSAILVAIAAPNLADMATASRLNSISDRWVSSATLARSEAMKRNRAVTLCASTNGTTCATTGGAQAWSSGWLIGHNIPGTWTVLEQQAAVSTGYRLEVADGTTPVYSVVFQPSGLNSTVATATVCRSSPSGSLQQRQINLSLTGRTQVSKADRTSACPS